MDVDLFAQIKKMLDDLADLEAHKQIIQMDKRVHIDSVLTPEIAQALSDIDAEFGDKMDVVNSKIEQLRNSIKPLVVQHGKTVKGSFMQAVWSKPRVTWDTARLEGFAVNHPELLNFRKIGQPVISFRDNN